MSRSYERLVFLAEELDTPSTRAKVLELNQLLSVQDLNDIKDRDLQLFDDLISTLSITGNLFAERSEAIIKLQEDIRSRRSK